MSKNRTFSSEISERYALALYELSQEQNQTEEFVSNMITFIKIFNSNKDLKNFIKNPTYSVQNQKIIFDKILNLMNFNQLAKNFFSVLLSLT